LLTFHKIYMAYHKTLNSCQLEQEKLSIINGLELYPFNNGVNCLYSVTGKQHRQHTYNTTRRPIPATIVAVENHYIFTVCICSPGYPACNVHAPYCHLWPVGFTILVHIISLLTAPFSKKSY